MSPYNRKPAPAAVQKRQQQVQLDQWFEMERRRERREEEQLKWNRALAIASLATSTVTLATLLWTVVRGK